MRTPITIMACLLAACGGGGGGPAGPGSGNNNPPAGPAQSAVVEMRTAIDAYGYAGASTFNPGSVTIARGGTVTWSN